jgi:ATP diphosphatase
MSPPLDRLLAIMARLRDPAEGCPWDVEQSFASIAPHTIEEAYEVADAIARGDLSGLREELGDLLLQVVFHARMAEEQGTFTFADVAEAICDKLVRRHPHVFADARIDSAEAQTRAWESHKAAERAAKAPAADAGQVPEGTLAGIALALPALLRAAKLQSRAARVGFDWPDVWAALPKINEELAELTAELEGLGAAGVSLESQRDRLEDELGDLLFAAVNVARKLTIDPEAALRRANGKFERRFGAIEARLREHGRTLEGTPLAELDRLWDEVKADEPPATGNQG